MIPLQHAILAAAAFAIALLAIAVYRHLNLAHGFLLGIDINKSGRIELPEGTGIALLAPLWVAGAYLLLAGEGGGVFGWLLLVSAFALMGFWDDTKQKFARGTIPWAFRAVLAAAVALVFAYFCAPQPPPFWPIPVALFIAGAASFQNTFAGLNGWETGSGFIISAAVLYLLRSTALMPLAAVLCACALALLIWNRHPARVFPGDSGTLLIGSGVAGLMVLNGGMQAMAIVVLFFIPHIFDLLLKALTNPGDMSQAKAAPYRLLPDGRLAVPRPKAAAGAGPKAAEGAWAKAAEGAGAGAQGGGRVTYDFAKILLRIFGPMREWQVVAVIWAVVAANCIAVMLLFGAL